MKRTATIVALVGMALITSNAAAQTNDHFARQRQEAIARQAATQQHFSQSRSSSVRSGVSHLGHWGGPTTTNRFYHPNHGYGQSIRYYPVNPFGYGFPSYGYYGYGAYGRNPYCGIPGGTGIYIHREIYHSR